MNLGQQAELIAAPSIEDHISAIQAEDERDARFLHLTANEPWVSANARRFASSRLADRYFTGPGNENGVVSFGPFTFLGFPGIARLIKEAEEAACEMLGASAVNVNCISGLNTMTCVILALTEPGDAIVSADPAAGGHFATSGVIERTGRTHVPIPYDPSAATLELDRVEHAVRRHRLKALYLDVSSCVDAHDLASLRRAVGPGVMIVYDASHSLGLIMGGRFQSPLEEGADVVCGNTHKTLPGPQKGLVAFGDKRLAERANSVINRWFVSSTHTASMIALGVTLLEMREFGRAYATQVIANANALGRAFDHLGLPVRRCRSGGFTKNHQVHLFCREFGDSESVAAAVFRAGISVNVDSAIGPGPYLRFGTQEVTRRGMREAEMARIAELVAQALIDRSPNPDEAAELATTFRSTHYSFDVG